jgi:hypothetical protein
MANMNGSASATRAISPSADLITESGLASGRSRRGAGRSCLQRIGVDIVVNGGKLLKLAHYIVRSWPAQRANGFTRQLLAVAILKRSRVVNDNSKSDPRTHTKSLKNQSLSFLPFRVI